MTAIVAISESELNKVMKWDYSFTKDKPQEFLDLLFSLGLDIYKPYELQENVIHRNRFNEVVQCHRFVGAERLDREWLASGYASREAKLEGSGSQMVKDLDPYKYHKL